jgi:tetratricopeptide (TPR) repeat protein
VSILLIALMGALATNPPAAVPDSPGRKADLSPKAVNADDPVEKELEQLMEADDAAQAEVDRWIVENQKFAAQGAGVPSAELNRRIRARFDEVRKAYDDFIARHPRHASARVAYASFLNDLGEEDNSFVQLEKARELDPKDPAVWNNLANYHGHNGSLTKAFDYYARAIELNPNEPVYYHNFGTTVFLFRKDAMEHFKINEQQVFDKALSLYAQAVKLDPTDFPLATDVARTYYGIKPPRTEEALRSWTNALSLAHDEVEREGVYVHLARIKTHAGRFDEARGHLHAITNEMYADLKKTLTRVLKEKEAEARETNAPPVKAD